MKRINKKLVEALDKLIAKYSGEEIAYDDEIMRCPLCDAFHDLSKIKICNGCPNTYFNPIVGCLDRGNLFEKLDFSLAVNSITLKQFWTDYKSLYLQRIYTNSEIMEILIKPFKEQE